MIGKSTIKLIKSLAIKKYRIKENLFLVEGNKMVLEVLNSSLKIKHLIVSDHFNSKYSFNNSKVEQTSIVEPNIIKQASLLQHPQESLAVCYLPRQKEFPDVLPKDLSVYLDGIQDPGNMGTIIRICDWFGIRNIYCSLDTVDLYNPKVIQASMGSFRRITLHECSFDRLSAMARHSGIPIYGTFINGENIYNNDLPKQAVLVMGNEGNGIRPIVEKQITHRLSIPNLSQDNDRAESLNVSVAAAIICSEFKRSYSK